MRRKLAITPEEREILQKIRQAHLSQLGIDAALVSRLSMSRQQRTRELLLSHASVAKPFPLPLDPADGDGNMEMWWAQTRWYSNAPGIDMSWEDGQWGGVIFDGLLEVRDDTLQHLSMGTVAQFGLGADRIPDSARGLVRSAPVVRLDGSVLGNAAIPGFFDGDQWSKCWLEMRQSVYVSISNFSFLGSDLIPFGSNTSSRNLVFVEKGSGIQLAPSPTWIGEGGPFGLSALPPVQFDLRPDITSVQIDLEFTFALQLEGDYSTMKFDQAKILTIQWKLEPVSN